MNSTSGTPTQAPVQAQPKATICHITTVHTPTDTRIYHKECLSLARAGYDVHLVAPADVGKQLSQVHLHAIPRHKGRLARMLLGPWQAYGQVLDITPRPQVCHLHDPELLPIGQLLRLRGFKVIFDVHENISDDFRSKTYLPRLLRPIVAWTYQISERFLTRGMPTVHVLNSIAARYLGRKIVLRNLPNRQAPFTPGRSDPACPRLVYIGAITRDRCAPEMVRVAGELRRRGQAVQLWLIGPVTEPGLDEELRRLIADENVADSVVITGNLPREQALAEMAKASIGLCLFAPVPNNLNSLPTKICEYMQAGLPVVASHFECWREYLIDTGSGVQVDPLDVSAIASAVQSLLADPQKMAAMGEAGSRAVQAELCWENEEPKLLDFYRNLLAGR